MLRLRKSNIKLWYMLINLLLCKLKVEITNMAIVLDYGRNIKRLTLIQTVVYQCRIHRSYPSLHTDSVLRQCSKGAMQNVSLSIHHQLEKTFL